MHGVRRRDRVPEVVISPGSNTLKAIQAHFSGLTIVVIIWNGKLPKLSTDSAKSCLYSDECRRFLSVRLWRNWRKAVHQEYCCSRRLIGQPRANGAISTS
jgi:hypothetical protein